MYIPPSSYFSCLGLNTPLQALFSNTLDLCIIWGFYGGGRDVVFWVVPCSFVVGNQHFRGCAAFISGLKFVTKEIYPLQHSLQNVGFQLLNYVEQQPSKP